MHSLEGNGSRVGTLTIATDDIHAHALAPRCELVGGGRAEGIGGTEDHRLIFCHEDTRQLADGRGLTGTVDAHHEDNGRLRGAVDLRALKVEGAIHVGADEGEQLLAQDLADARLIRDGLDGDAALERLHQRVGSLKAEVGDKERFLDLLPVGGAELASAQNTENGAPQ